MTSMLFEDPERLAARPERRLHGWAQTAKPISALADVAIEELGRELSRSVLVDPAQSTESAAPLVERLLAATPITPEACLPVADAFNALACIGVPLPVSVNARLAHWLPGLTAVEPPFPGRIRAGFAALALGDVRRAAYVAREPRGELVGGLEFPNDMRAFLGYAIAIARSGAPRVALENALQRAGEELDALCATNQLDEATILWLARFAYHRIDGQPLASVAARAHDWLWTIPAKLEQARREAAAAPPPFPIARTIGEGAYRVEQWLRGSGSQRLYRGVEVATGERVLVALDDHFARRQSVDELRAAVSYRSPGVFELAHVGAFDGDVDHWAVVEKVTAGDWLPRIIGPADPWTAPGKAIELGISAGEILLRAAERGTVLAQIRPDLMWAERTNEHYAVTGLSARAIELFRRARGDMFTQPLFERWYRAPEAATPDVDDRAVTFALAVMIAEWATGVYPLRSSFGMETAEHDSIDAPAPLRALLEAALREDRNDRPSLAEFVADLRRL